MYSSTSRMELRGFKMVLSKGSKIRITGSSVPFGTYWISVLRSDFTSSRDVVNAGISLSGGGTWIPKGGEPVSVLANLPRSHAARRRTALSKASESAFMSTPP